MSITGLSPEQFESGLQKFLAQDPQAIERLSSVTPQLANHLGIEFSELHRIETHKALCERATSLQVDSFVYLLQFAIDTEAERQVILVARDASIASSLNLNF